MTETTTTTSNGSSQERLGSLPDNLFILGVLLGLILGIVNALLSAYAFSVASHLWFSTFALLTCADMGCVFLLVAVRKSFDRKHITRVMVAAIAITLCVFWFTNIILSFNYGLSLWGLS